MKTRAAILYRLNAPPEIYEQHLLVKRLAGTIVSESEAIKRI